MSNVVEHGYVGDEDHYLIKCDQCGHDFFTDNRAHHFCSRKCYKDAKYEYDGDL